MQVGSVLPLYFQLFDYLNDKYIKAFVRDEDGMVIYTVNMILLSNGLYFNSSLYFPPGTDFLTIQYIVYDDSGYTEISGSEGAGLSRIDLTSQTLSVALQVGSTLPLYCQLSDYANNKYVKAFVRDKDNALIMDSPIELSLISNGLYYSKGLSFPPGTNWLSVQYIVYDDSDYSIISDSEGAGFNLFILASEQPFINFPPYTNIQAFVKADICQIECPISDTIIKGSDRSLIVNLVQTINCQPYDLTNTSVIEFRFRNEDGTILSLKSTDESFPVQIINNILGKIICILTSAQTSLLMARIPAPFTIILTQNNGKTVINVPTQLAIIDSDV